MKIDEEKLVRAIEMAMDAAAEDENEEHYDVRWSQDRGIYIVLREHADGGNTLRSTVEGFEPGRRAARRVLNELE